MDNVAQSLSQNAQAGPGEPRIETLVACLRDSGVLAACAPAEAGGEGLAHQPPTPGRTVELLAQIGGADLSIGRLFEGHVNAVKLICLYAEGPARELWLDVIARGEMFGVWGADGPEPVRFEGGSLRGAKLFASGADVIDWALISARDPNGDMRLFVIPRTRLVGRLFPDEWSVTGMKSTASGRVDLDRFEVGSEEELGGPGDYHREPHFQGGVWRYAAVQMGAMRAMTAATSDQLRARGQHDAPLQSTRLRRMVMACETSRLWLENAARAVERPEAPPQSTATAILARLTVEREAVALMQAMDEALGAASFSTSHPVERRRRDLQFYLRQANPDGLGQTAMDLLSGSPSLSRRWHLA